MRYVNWGVVSRHSHAPILISLLLSNDLLHLFYRDCYSQNATVLLFFSPLFLPFHSFVRLTPTHQRDVYKGIVSHVRDETLLEYLILCAKICVLNILLGPSNIFPQMLPICRINYIIFHHIHQQENSLISILNSCKHNKHPVVNLLHNEDTIFST